MYNENSNFSIKNVIIQFLFVALFIFVLIWLFPLKSDINKLKVANGKITTVKETNTDLSVLVDRIFNENIIAMKDSAKSYYTTERLPQNVGDKVKMTLGEMIDKKIILPFKDKKGEACSLTESYVEITKKDTEFLMKVNLKCGEEENYLLVYMGCYDYCSTAVCEKSKTDVKAPVVYAAKSSVAKVVTPVETKTETVKPVIEQTANGNNNNQAVQTINGNNNSQVTGNQNATNSGKNEGIINSGTIVVDNSKTTNVTTTIVNKTIKTPEQPQNFIPEENPKCATINGRYYDKNGNETTKATYEAQCLPAKVENPKCGVKGNKYYDKNGNETTQAIYEDQCLPKEYQYKKTTSGSCTESGWSDWSTSAVSASANTAVQTKTQTIRKITGYKITTGYDYSKPIYKEVEETIGYKKVTVCTQYSNVVTGYNYGTEWKDTGKVVYSNQSPTNTSTTRYIKVSENSADCKNCKATTTKGYKEQKVTSTPITERKCTKTEVVEEPIKTKTQKLTGYETKIISKTPVYEDKKVTYYRYKTRTCTGSTTDIKWSSSASDSSLIKAGYTYTGVTRIKK